MNCRGMTKNMEQVNYKSMWKALCQKNPELARELVEDSTPLMDDFSFIPKVRAVLDNLTEYPPATLQEQTDYNRLVVLVAVRLYDPDLFNGSRGCMRSGLRKYLAENIGCCPTRISKLYQEGKSLLSLYKSFRKEATDLFNEINFQLTGFQVEPGSVRFLN